jgi:opacity protein-like surface antigen
MGAGVEGVRSFFVGVLGLLIAACSSAAFSDDLEAPPSPRCYVAGIAGASFASLTSGGTNTAGIPTPNTGTVSDDLFTAGGAFGAAFDRPHGLLRAEVEGRGRELLQGETASVEPFAVAASDGWSVMANIWRDYFFTNRLGVYGGGGIGAGGYRLAVEDSLAIVTGASTASEFAWQAGGGVTYRVGPHVTLDLGYRFFDIGTASTPLLLGDGSPAGDYTSAFSASELLLCVRIDGPFRQFFR